MTDAPERTAVYHIRGEADVLLYIGMTNSVPHRWNNHMRIQPWWDELRSLTVEWYEAREEAEAAEEAAIKAELPKYNVTHLKRSLTWQRKPLEEVVQAAALPEPELEPRRDDEDLLTMTEVAEIARISEEVLRTRLGRGVGPEGGFRIGKQLVFRKGKVRAWIKAVEEAQNRQGAA